jgi:hypothetical protein
MLRRSKWSALIVVTYYLFLPVQNAEEKFLRRVVFAVGVGVPKRLRRKRPIYQNENYAVTEIVSAPSMKKEFVIFVGNLIAKCLGNKWHSLEGDSNSACPTLGRD